MHFKHLAETGETYSKHARAALYMARKATKVAVVLIIHALVPSMFIHTATTTLDHINTFRAARLRKADPVGQEG